MFCGCGCALMWPKKSSRGPMSEDEPIYSPRIMKGMQEKSSTNGDKATVVRFRKPSRIHFRRPAVTGTYSDGRSS